MTSAALDDNAADTTVYGGAGNDQFQVGQIFKSPATHSPAWQTKTSSPPSYHPWLPE